MEIKRRYLSTKIENIKISDILIYEKAKRNKLSEEDILSIAANIKKNGLILPVLLRRDIKKRKKYILVDGLRRLAAIQYLGGSYVPSFILSLTDAEAKIIYLCEDFYKLKLNVFEKAEAITEILKNERISKNELSDMLGITTAELKELLRISALAEDELKIIKNHNFDYDFIMLYLEFEKEERLKYLNNIILKSFDNSEAKKYLNEIKNPKEKPLRAGSLTDKKIILNSIERMAESLQKSGIEAEGGIREEKEWEEYVLRVKNKRP